LCSILFRPELELDDLHLVPTVVGLAARQAIEDATGVETNLKWPNDILVGSRKVAGMLSEVVSPRADQGPETEDRSAIVVGIGINLTWPDGFPADSDDEESAAIAATATTLQSVAHRRIDRDELLETMIGHLEPAYRLLSDASGRRQVMDRYRRSCSTPGQRVTISEANGSFDADAVAITDHGLLLVMVDGHPQSIDAADVIHIRPVAATWEDPPRGPGEPPPTTLTGP
jgi:BirA family biotin operon repressor/biotin-[acetyl-CoA-carboxylase] ligase